MKKYRVFVSATSYTRGIVEVEADSASEATLKVEDCFFDDEELYERIDWHSFDDEPELEVTSTVEIKEDDR